MTPAGNNGGEEHDWIGRCAIGFLGGVVGFLTSGFVILLINLAAIRLQSLTSDVDDWKLVPLSLVWWISGGSALFAAFSPDRFVDAVGGIWRVLSELFNRALG